LAFSYKYKIILVWYSAVKKSTNLKIVTQDRSNLSLAGGVTLYRKLMNSNQYINYMY